MTSVNPSSTGGSALRWVGGRAENRHLVEGAVVALSHGRASRHIDTGAIREHFAGRCHAVIDIPWIRIWPSAG